MTPSHVLPVSKDKMTGLPHKQHALSGRFISHGLSRNIRIEEDLIDRSFNSSEKRLARALLLSARYGKQDTPARLVPKASQQTSPRISFAALTSAATRATRDAIHACRAS